MSTTITNEADLLVYFWVDDIDQLSEAIYDTTSCGAWVEFLNNGIVIGSIVEGCDFGTMTYPLYYPFNIEDLDLRIDAVEKEADALWKWCNGVSDITGITDAEAGVDAPDVDTEYRYLGQGDRSS